MNLRVIEGEDRSSSWYAGGLKFTCTQCGNCCTGPTGFVWISEVEISRLAEHLKMTPEQVAAKYCRTVAGRVSLKERRTREGNYDCIFLKEQPKASASAKPTLKKACSIYGVRPLQCRTWPFWPENLSSPGAWKDAGKRCHGMDAGARHFPLEKIRGLRDAQDWPDNPPTSSRNMP